jgi:hypothetical protein
LGDWQVNAARPPFGGIDRQRTFSSPDRPTVGIDHIQIGALAVVGIDFIQRQGARTGRRMRGHPLLRALLGFLNDGGNRANAQLLAGQRVQAGLDVGVAVVAFDQQGQDLPLYGRGQADHGRRGAKDLLQCLLGGGFPGVEGRTRDIERATELRDETIFAGMCKHVAGPLHPLSGCARMRVTHVVLPGVYDGCGTSTIHARVMLCNSLSQTVKSDRPILKHALQLNPSFVSFPRGARETHKQKEIKYRKLELL